MNYELKNTEMKANYIKSDPLCALGGVQKKTLKMMLTGMYISVVRDHRDNSESITLTDGDNSYYVPRSVLESLSDRGLLVHRDATMCLELSNDHYHLKKEYITPVRQLLNN